MKKKKKKILSINKRNFANKSFGIIIRQAVLHSPIVVSAREPSKIYIIFAILELLN